MKFIILITFICVLSAACSFDYGSSREGDDSKPDIVMENVDYVRMRGGNLNVRFRAELVERYEERNTMNLRNISFEQFENQGTEINTKGTASEAIVELETGNARLSGGVKVDVDSEDITIETSGLHWLDEEKQLLGNGDDEVIIYRSDGTRFTGKGFSASIRERIWEFVSGVEGSYVDEQDFDDNQEFVE